MNEQTSIITDILVESKPISKSTMVVVSNGTRLTLVLAFSALLSLTAVGCQSSAVVSPPTTPAASAQTGTVATDSNEEVGADLATEQESAANGETNTAEPYRVAPAGTDVAVLRWDSDAVWQPGHTGEWLKVADGPFVEVAEVSNGGLVFQRAEQEPVIWMLTGSEPQKLIVADEHQRLTLEGVGLNDDDVPIVFYQRHESGSPASTRSSLRTYNLETGEVREIMETGAWEAGTHFDHLSLEPIAIGTWSSGATMGNALIDVGVTSQTIWDQVTEASCTDGEADCVFYENATVVGGRNIGVRPIWNEDAGWVDQVGVFEFDSEADTERLIAAFAWDNGLWYVEDIFGLPPDSVVLSLSDGPNRDGNPLPAAVISLDSGEAFTVPDAWFVRPAYLS